MADINALRSMYFVQETDTNPPSESLPQTFPNNKVTPLIDCATYNQEIEKALNLVGTGPDEASNAGHFILIANWWLGLSGGTYAPAIKNPSGFGPKVINTLPYRLDGPGGTKILIDILKQKAQKGVDVRVLGWVSFAVMDSAVAQKSGAGSIARVNALTMKSIKDLRDEPKIGSKAMLNVIAHTAGGVHCKLVVAGTKTEAIGFTGGLDFEVQRWAHPQHSGLEYWHDVAAKVEGPAVQALLSWFEDMWNENVRRPERRFKFEGTEMPSYLRDAAGLPPKLMSRYPPLPTTPKGKHHVQSLRTIPQFNYKSYNVLPENAPISLWPKGLFEFRVAMKKALTSAQTYVYMEDQSFWSQEILGWVNTAIKKHPSLKVILLTSGGADPNDPVFPDAILSNSINHGLLAGLTSAQLGNVRMYKRMGDYVRASVLRDGVPDTITITAVAANTAGTTSRVTTDVKPSEVLPKDALAKNRWLIRVGSNAFRIIGNDAAAKDDFIVLIVEKVLYLPGPIVPVAGTYELQEHVGITIHSKTTLVDDQWAVIGSGNIMRRSLYTDVEHGVSLLDEDELLVKEYRKALWNDHFRHTNPTDFDDIQASLHAWESEWGVDGAAPFRPFLLERISLPITPDAPLEGAVKDKYDDYEDLDSREEWGGLWP